MSDQAAVPKLSERMRARIFRSPNPSDSNKYSDVEEVAKLEAKLEAETLAAYLQRQWEWSKRTFGPGKRTGGVTRHIEKELAEIRENPSDYTEWIDVVTLALDGFWRHGGTISEVMQMLQAKQEKNFAREWPTPTSEDEAVEHVGGANHRIKELEKQLEAERQARKEAEDKEEAAHLRTINERDYLQEQFDCLVVKLGIETEYSNLRSVEDVCDDACDRVTELEAALKHISTYVPDHPQSFEDTLEYITDYADRVLGSDEKEALDAE